METFKRLLLNNKAWAQEKLNLSDDYFQNLAKNEFPRFFWIGCSDSAVPAEEITGTQPGEIFVHRNIGNIVLNDDKNFLGSLQYAVQSINVKHIIVCGHYGCKGVEQALDETKFKRLDEWLEHIRKVYHKYEDEFKDLKNDKEIHKKLVEFNVREQVRHLMDNEIIKENWKNSQWPVLHGWVFDVETGIIKDLIHQLAII